MTNSIYKQIFKLGLIAALSGLISVIILALASHSLPKLLDLQKVSAITTAAQIQLFHSILVISSFQLISFSDKVKFNLALQLIMAGSLIFSISIYLLSFRDLIGLPQLKVIGPVTPIGGIILIAGWALLSLKFYRLSFARNIQNKVE